MTQTTISYQGEPGANSHIICSQAYPDWTPLPCPSFEDAFAAVIEGRAARAMIPIENSIAGRVADIHHLIPTSPLHIVAEHFLPIHFQLMALPGTPVSALTSVHSHVHALGQCRRLIRRLGLKAVVAGDTAGAAREVMEARDPSRAALAPALAAEVYGLDILARDVEDESHNTTRFVVFSPEPEAPAADVAAVTSFVFRVRNLPAALYKALGGFATNGVNMSKLESYMIEGQFSATQFYAEVDGRPDDAGLARALEELGYFSRELRIIGTYPAHPFREASRVDILE
ncbi:prephenate dehydratase [Methylobacterium sp. Leaf399]|uniref:prephenate dehydratase n=1 Tax=Methylobacterium sp. Leaf399 TaxID=1736364 RepID=UPI0006F278D5|nr:prephenate dehydratase [Methylobacterium sp. Leaf399]KQT08655.1 prephenate dehydratase [Methylobacterium sp. Leaf399]